MTAIASYAPRSAFSTGLACKCPRCGRAGLFAGYPTLAAHCEVWVVAVLGRAPLLPRPAKGIMVALQHKNRTGEVGDGWLSALSSQLSANNRQRQSDS